MDKNTTAKNATKKYNRSPKQIIEDLIKHVKKQGGRALNANDGCEYQTKCGKTCGHSMALKKSHRKKVVEIDNSDSAIEVIDNYTDQCHLKKYQGHEPSFWDKIQSLHDRDWYWDDSTLDLNEEGRKYAENIIKKFS